jgi:hypothetical protein
MNRLACSLIGVLLVAAFNATARSADITFEVLPGAKTGLRPAMEKWYELEMERQGGPGKQSHGWWPWGIRVFDFDRDGALDILASHHGVPRSIVLRSQFPKLKELRFNNATAELGVDNRDLPGADDRPWVWDFDGDGWLDIAGLSDESPASSVWNSAGQKFLATSKPLLPKIAHPREVLDLNGDGYLDVDGGSKGQLFYVPESKTYRHDIARRFNQPDGMPAELVQTLESVKKERNNRFFALDYWTHCPLGYDTLGYDPRPIDLDGDGRSDVVVQGSGGYGATYLGRYLFRGSDDSFTDRTLERGLPENGAPILVEDLTGDGRPEILVAGEKDSGLYLNDGGGKFTRVAGKLTDFLVRRGPYLLRAFRADLNNDGWLDLVVSNPRLGLAAVFQNQGRGEFQQMLSLSNCWDSNPIAIADLDSDGRLDLVIGGASEKDSKTDITIFRNATQAADHYLQIAPRMPAPNPYAVGAVIEVFPAGELEKSAARPIFVEKSHIDGTAVHVGLGEGQSCDVRVTFPGGKVVLAKSVAADRVVTIDRDAGVADRKP